MLVDTASVIKKIESYIQVYKRAADEASQLPDHAANRNLVARCDHIVYAYEVLLDSIRFEMKLVEDIKKEYPSEENNLSKITEAQFHSMWSTAVGMPGYDKTVIKPFFSNLLKRMISDGLVVSKFQLVEELTKCG